MTNHFFAIENGNAICASSLDPEAVVDEGLSDFGTLVVQEMNRLGIMIDVSRVSDKSFFDILSFTNTPVIASHSAVRSLRDHPRNLSDDMLEVNNGCTGPDLIEHSPLEIG